VTSGNGGSGPSEDANAAVRVYRDLVIYRRLLALARPYWLHIAGVLLVSLLAMPLALLAPVPLKIAVDSVIGSRPLPGLLDAILPGLTTSSELSLLLVIACLLVVIEGLTQLQAVADEMLRTYTGEKLQLDLRARLFRRLQQLSLSYHDTRGTADAGYRVQYDAIAIRTVAVDGVIPLLTAAFTVLGMLYVTARIDPILALVTLIVTPVLGLLTWAYRRRLRARHREVKRLESSALAVVQEVLTALRVVKAFGQEHREEERFVDRSIVGMRARLRVALIDGMFGVLIGVVTALGAGAVLFIGVRRVNTGHMTLGELLLVMGYLAQLYKPMQTISKTITRLQSALASAERAFSVLDEAPDVIERPAARSLVRAQGAIEFRDVYFAYDGGPPTLQHVSFAVTPGARVGIQGTTGAGKTTLVSLLMRFYDPTSGAILLDGVDVRDYRLADLRNQFALVLQEPVLFSTSIAENIGYARPGASFDDIVGAARAAHAHDFISALPAGYDTPVGERGMRLSGGERQRISLARAFLKDAPLLILDEPTSSVDVRTEAVIFEAMERLMQGRTVFMIAHRLSTLDACDVRWQVEGGCAQQLARSGTAPRAPDRRRAMAERRQAAAGVDAAVAAWARLGAAGARVSPAAGVTLKPIKRGSAVYRLVGMGPGGSDVIAKRTRRATVELESSVYADLLPCLPVATVRCYGVAQADDDAMAWLFLEDAGGIPYSRQRPDHRRLAARWLAALHTAAVSRPASSALPLRDAAHYRELLERSRRAIEEGFGNPALTAEHRTSLRAILRRSETLLGRWAEVEQVCAAMPQTLVHGDFVAKNVRVRGGANRRTLVAFDWENAGWGPPGIDLPAVDPDEYRRKIRGAWPTLGPSELAMFARMGRVFWLTSCVEWETWALDTKWVGRLMDTMPVYERHLGAVMAELGWT
jgi:ATP-binding cassette, subfamily B, bacterial